MIRFIDVLGRTLSKPRIRELCQIVELTKEETKLLIHRCSDGLSYDQIEDLYYTSITQQKKMVPAINSKINLWVIRNPDFFCAKELKAINQRLNAYKLPPLGME